LGKSTFALRVAFPDCQITHYRTVIQILSDCDRTQNVLPWVKNRVCGDREVFLGGLVFANGSTLAEKSRHWIRIWGVLTTIVAHVNRYQCY
jgi:hypothetical protein